MTPLERKILTLLFDLLPFEAEATASALASVTGHYGPYVAKCLHNLEEQGLIERRIVRRKHGRWGCKWKINLLSGQT